MMGRFSSDQWALILGGSSGFGLATAKRLAADGMSIALVHRDRRGAMAAIDAQLDAIRSSGATLLTFNLDALSSAGRGEVLEHLAARLSGQGRVRLLLHSIALGNLKPLAPPPAADEPAPLLGEEDFARTVEAMGTSLATWTQALFQRGLFAESARVIGLTSEGNQRVWRGYAAVSAAKAALEAVVRSIAVEFAAYGVRANVLQPGVTETPALSKIPGHQQMIASAQLRNPCGRLTTPEDVANVVRLLCTDDAAWINGALIRVDGGECLGA